MPGFRRGIKRRRGALPRTSSYRRRSLSAYRSGSKRRGRALFGPGRKTGLRTFGIRAVLGRFLQGNGRRFVQRPGAIRRFGGRSGLLMAGVRGFARAGRSAGGSFASRGSAARLFRGRGRFPANAGIAPFVVPAARELSFEEQRLADTSRALASLDGPLAGTALQRAAHAFVAATEGGLVGLTHMAANRAESMGELLQPPQQSSSEFATRWRNSIAGRRTSAQLGAQRNLAPALEAVAATFPALPANATVSQRAIHHALVMNRATRPTSVLGRVLDWATGGNAGLYQPGVFGNTHIP